MLRPFDNVLWCTALSLNACIATFVQTDVQFVPKVRADVPPVFVNAMPGRRYSEFRNQLGAGPLHSVGLIQVTLPRAAPVSDFVAAAAEKGRAAGCDAVVDSAVLLRGGWR